MGWWQFSADTLAGSRFVISQMAEVNASLFALHHGAAAHPGERAWLDAHGPAYRARLAADPVLAELVPAALGERHHWIADFVTPTPGRADGDPVGDVAAGLAEIRATSRERARANLMISLRAPLPAALDDADPAALMADLLEWVWDETVRPYWPRRRRVLEADVVARTRQLSAGGWASALDTLRPGMRWLGESRLQINAHDYPPRDLSGARLFFVPVTPDSGWVSWRAEEGEYAIIYPCAGALAAPPEPVPEGLGRLLGEARARVLVRLDTPLSTTQLVALTGQGLGSVGRHLRVLLDAGLVGRRRAGRSVLYYRTAAGDAVVEAAGPAGV
ncbi:ArsR/SmtB family transcription factor [Streptomyces boninensis]|uniref:ArsR/SmtB family transcription factor n=1 Tax=Streptomyces boninensis TaxID=2039455 RepID=UPI003B214541